MVNKDNKPHHLPSECITFLNNILCTLNDNHVDTCSYKQSNYASSIKFNCFLPTLLNHDSDTTKTLLLCFIPNVNMLRLVPNLFVYFNDIDLKLKRAFNKNI